MYKKNSHEIIDFHLHSVKSGGSLARSARFCASNSQASLFFLRGRRAALGACQYLRVVFSWQAQRFVLVHCNSVAGAALCNVVQWLV